jgi:hypothetical protein
MKGWALPNNGLLPKKSAVCPRNYLSNFRSPNSLNLSRRGRLHPAYAAQERRAQMPLYLISYDIASYDRKEYLKLWEKLEELGAIKILYSEWVLVEGIGKATHIYEEIAPCVVLSDRLLVQELTKDASWDKLLISDENFRKLLSHARG